MTARVTPSPDGEDWYRLSGWLQLCEYVDASERTLLEIERLVELLPIADYPRVLDLACGTGRISRRLAALGYSVTGIDVSALAIDLARQKSQSGDALAFQVGDMRDLPELQDYDAVLCLFNSFGYFDHATNQRALVEMGRAVRPGGCVIIGIPNIWRLACTPTARHWLDLGGNIHYLDERSFDLSLSEYDANWRFMHADGRVEVARVRSRCYTPIELRYMMEAANLALESIAEAPSGVAFTAQSVEIIAVGRRAAV